MDVWMNYKAGSLCSTQISKRPAQCSIRKGLVILENMALGLTFFLTWSQIILLMLLPGSRTTVKCPRTHIEGAETFDLELTQAHYGRQLVYNREEKSGSFGCGPCVYNRSNVLAWHTIKYSFWTCLITSREGRFYSVMVHWPSFRKMHSFSWNSF